MTRPAPKGWCPGAWRPMETGDGWIVRLRPRACRLDATQVLGLCATALVHGNGLIDLTSRANLQIRGVRSDTLAPLQTDLGALGLLDADAGTETRRNILTSPMAVPGDLTITLTDALQARLGELPDLPAKFGFAVDCGETRLLAQASADIRIERGETGLIVRADGAARGRAVDPDTAIDTAITLTHWFAVHRGTARRMKDAVLALPEDWQTSAPAPEAPPLQPGTSPAGQVLGAAFGSIDAGALAALMTGSQATALITTPWRLFVLMGAETLPASPFLTHPDDPLLRVDACPGVPLCTSATVDTRGLAKVLAGAPDTLHVSGCAKGCARPRAAKRTLVGRDGRFDLVIDGCSWDEPARRGLDPDALAKGTEQI